MLRYTCSYVFHNDGELQALFAINARKIHTKCRLSWGVRKNVLTDILIETA